MVSTPLATRATWPSGNYHGRAFTNEQTTVSAPTVDFVKVTGSVESLFNFKSLMPTASSEEDEDRVLLYGQVRNMILHRPAGLVSL